MDDECRRSWTVGIVGDVEDDINNNDDVANDAPEDDEDNMSETSSAFDDWLLGKVADDNPSEEGFDLYKEFEAIHNKLHGYVLAGKYPADDYNIHIDQFWIPD